MNRPLPRDSVPPRVPFDLRRPKHERPRVFLNGKYIAQRTTGVQRAASSLLLALDARLEAEAEQTDWTLLCPRGWEVPVVKHMAIRHLGPRGMPLHLWEQWLLPAAAAGGLLVNLAGAAPFFARRQVCMLHDAAVFDHPQAYSRRFVVWYRLLFRRLARRGTGLLTVSSFSRERLAHHLGIERSRFTVIRGGSDHFDALEAEDGVLERYGLATGGYLLAVGSSNPTKNLEALVTAFERLPAGPQRRLVIVGGANRRVFAAADGGGMTAGVVRTGHLDDASLKALYRGAAAFVFPSLYEGFGLPPLEAMACGCPVAASHAASIPEVCGDAALYFDPNSVDSIAQAMQRLLNDGALRERLRSAGRARAAQFSWDHAARLLLQALQTSGSIESGCRAEAAP